MAKLLSILFVVTGLLAGQTMAFDESLEQSFGKNRVKIQRLEAPKNLSQSKMLTARARYESRMSECRGKADRSKQYCMQEADNQLMIDERRVRDSARKAAQE